MIACSKEDYSFLQNPDFGVSQELAEHRQLNISDIKYDLKVKVPKALDQMLQGSNKITFNLNSTERPVIIDFKVSKEAIHKVSIGNQEIDYQFLNGHIILAASALNEGVNEVLLEFDLGNQSLNRQKDYLYTLLVPDRASTAFPCFDQPNMKAKYKLELDIPQDWIALANARLLSEAIADGRKLLVFAETELLPSYLFDFVVGDFERLTKTVRGREMTMIHRESDPQVLARNIDDIFELHEKSIRWLEDYTGIEMPFQKFDFALLPSFQYGGMEHPGAISYKASSLFLDENPSQNQELGRASLIAHETAHMWFGNLVTMDWFNDVWMKEVFANFMAAKMVNPSFPEINHDLRFTLSHYPRAYSVDRSRGSHPVQQELKNLVNAGSLYGSIIYQKAPIVMRMLEKEIGPLAMQKGLQNYLTSYSYGNATWDDLIEILDKESEVDLETWNKQWIKQAGMPHIKLEVKKEGEVSYLILQSKEGKGKKWQQSLDLALIGNEYTASKKLLFLGDPIKIELADSSEVKGIVANAGGYGYGFFELGIDVNRYLIRNINNYEDALLRGVIWINLWEHMLRGKYPPEELVNPFIESISKEEDILIKQRLLNYLTTLYWKFLDDGSQKKYNRQIESFLWTYLNQVDDKALKRSLFTAYRNLASSQEATSNLLRLWKKEAYVTGLALSERDDIGILKKLAVLEVDSIEQFVKVQIEKTENLDRKLKLEFLQPALSKDLNSRDEFFNSLKDFENRNVETWVQEGLALLHHPLRAANSEQYILPTLDLLQEIQSTGDIFFPKRVLDNTFSGHRSKEAAEVVVDFLNNQENYPPKLENKILQSVDLTWRASRIVNK